MQSMVDWQRKGNPVGSSDSYSPGVPAVAIAIVLGTRGRRSDSDSYRRPVATVALPWEPVAPEDKVRGLFMVRSE